MRRERYRHSAPPQEVAPAALLAPRGAGAIPTTVPGAARPSVARLRLALLPSAQSGADRLRRHPQAKDAASNCPQVSAVCCLSIARQAGEAVSAPWIVRAGGIRHRAVPGAQGPKGGKLAQEPRHLLRHCALALALLAGQARRTGAARTGACTPHPSLAGRVPRAAVHSSLRCATTQ